MQHTYQEDNMTVKAWGSDDSLAVLGGNGTINLADLLDLFATLGDSFGTSVVGDIDASCEVDPMKLQLLRATWGNDWTQGDLAGTNGSSDLTTPLAKLGEVCD